MLKRLLLTVTPAISVVMMAGGAVTPVPASASMAAVTASSGSAQSSPASGTTYHIVNAGVCLDASFAFWSCHTSPDPDDPPSLQEWVLVGVGHGTYRIWNRANTGWCLDLANFDAPCSKTSADQRWARVPAGGGAYYVEHRSRAGKNTCLDVFWTFKACSQGDKNQLWKFKPLS